ncbi:exosome nuclease subunit, partial [Linderina pennispora]
MSQQTPDFAQDFDAGIKAAFDSLAKATKAARRLPDDVDFHRALDEQLDAKIANISQRTLSLANALWAPTGSSRIQNIEDIAVKGEKGWEMGPGFRSVVDTVDTLLEKIDVGLDEVLRTPAHGFRSSVGAQSTPMIAAVATSDRRRTEVDVVHARNVPRPQINFADKPDNSASTPFVWKIRSKPHARVPLDYGLPGADVVGTPLGSHLEAMGISRPTSPGESAAATPKVAMNVALNAEELARAMSTAEENAVALPHPYEYEISHINYPRQLFEQQEAQKPRSWDETPFVFVDTPQQLVEMVEHLKTAGEIAIDLEHHSYRSFQGFTCLVQISSRSRDYVVDAIALRSELQILNEVTADPTKVKVFHGAASDILWLQRDFGVYIVGLFDTYHASKMLAMPEHSLKYLLATYCDFHADKKYQMADWRIRPLSKEMMHYARADTHFLLYVFDRMRDALLERGSESLGHEIANPYVRQSEKNSGTILISELTQLMSVALEKSAETSLRVYQKDGYDAEYGLGAGGWANLLRKWKHPFDTVQLAVFRVLHQWRDAKAREEDESTGYVLPNHMLYAISNAMPEDVPSLLATCTPAPTLVRLEGAEIVRLIVQAKRTTEARLGDMHELIKQAEEEAVGVRPAHTRFEDHDADVDGDQTMDQVPRVEDDVLSGELLASIGDMVAAESALFGASVMPGMAKAGLPVTPEAARAQEIRSTLVLAVAVPDQVLVGSQDMDVDEELAVEEIAKPKPQPTGPVVLSETYAKYKPEAQQRQPTSTPPQADKTALDLPTIALGDIDDSDDSDKDSAP